MQLAKKTASLILKEILGFGNEIGYCWVSDLAKMPVNVGWVEFNETQQNLE